MSAVGLNDHGSMAGAADLDRLVQIFGKDNTFVEIQNTGLEPQHQR